MAQLGPGTPSQIFGEFTLLGNNRTQSIKIRAAIQILGAALGLTAAESVTGAPTRSGSVGTSSLAAPFQPLPVFRVIERSSLSCLEEANQAHLRFVVRDSKGNELPNIGIEIRESGGEDTVYTGLKPERGVGYADLEVGADTFSINLVNGMLENPPRISIGAAPPDCSLDRGTTPRGWKLVLQQK